MENDKALYCLHVTDAPLVKLMRMGWVTDQEDHPALGVVSISVLCCLLVCRKIKFHNLIEDYSIDSHCKIKTFQSMIITLIKKGYNAMLC